MHNVQVDGNGEGVGDRRQWAQGWGLGGLLRAFRGRQAFPVGGNCNEKREGWIRA